MMCKVAGCENETEYDIDVWCEEHWKMIKSYFDSMGNKNES